jgi:hypothetical protein
MNQENLRVTVKHFPWNERRQSLEQETAFAAMDPTGSFKSVVWKMCIQIIIYENKKK